MGEIVLANTSEISETSHGLNQIAKRYGQLPKGTGDFPKSPGRATQRAASLAGQAAEKRAHVSPADGACRPLFVGGGACGSPAPSRLRARHRDQQQDSRVPILRFRERRSRQRVRGVRHRAVRGLLLRKMLESRDQGGVHTNFRRAQSRPACSERPNFMQSHH